MKKARIFEGEHHYYCFLDYFTIRNVTMETVK